MEKDFWLKRWENGETGWHQTEVEPNLTQNFSDLKPTRVLVPLCGKSLDLTWLAAKGHEVVGVELSRLAVETFFKEHSVDFTVARVGAFEVFRGGKYTIFSGDLFELGAEELGTIGAVYDRAALIALPPELRARYAAHMLTLLSSSAARPGFRFLQIVLEREPHLEKGPPFGVSSTELKSLYGKRFAIEPVSRELVFTEEDSGAKVFECVYRLVS